MYSIFTNVYLKKGDKLRLLHRAPNKAVWPDVLLGIGGKVEPDEDVFEAAKREFKEEAGAELLDLTLAGTLTWLDDTNQNGINYIFTATKYEGTLLEKCDEGTFEWVDIKDTLVDPRTAVHQLKYLPYLMNGQHFSQHLIFKGAFSQGQIVKDHNSLGYTNHRFAKKVASVNVSTSNNEKLDLVKSILAPYDVRVSRDDEGVSVDVEIFTSAPTLNALFKNGIKRNVEDAGLTFTPEHAVDFYRTKIQDGTNIVLSYAVTSGSKTKSVLVPARLTKTAKYDERIRDNFFWSFVQFNVNDKWTSYIDLALEDKQDIFGLLAQTILELSCDPAPSVVA